MGERFPSSTSYLPVSLLVGLLALLAAWLAGLWAVFLLVMHRAYLLVDKPPYKAR